MQYRLLSKIAPQYSYSGFVDHVNLSNFQSESLQTPGIGKIANMSTFYTPLRGSSSPYVQSKQLKKEEIISPKMEIDSAPKTETMPKGQTGFGKTELVLESLNQTQKHKLDDEVYNAMTQPVIKIKKTKYEPPSPVPKPMSEHIIKAEKLTAPKTVTGKGAVSKAKKHKFNVI